MSTIRIGLIGGGYWGKNLIREFNNLGVLDTVCDIDPIAIKDYKEKYPSLNYTSDWNDVLVDQKINAVCVSLPAELHYKFVKESLVANKDVYVEKPITLSIKEAEEIIELAKTRDKILMVGHILHYHPCIIKMKELIKEGKIGKIKNIVANRLSLGIFRTQENVLWSFAPHDISVILNLCDDQLPQKVFCSGIDHITKGVQDITNSILKYDDKYININVNWLNPYKEQRMSIIGEKGMLIFDDMINNKLTYFPEYISFKNGLQHIPLAIKDNGINIEVIDGGSPLLNECAHFVNCCNTRIKPITDGQEGLRVLKVLDVLQESLVEGKEIFMSHARSAQGSRNFLAHETAIIDEGAIIGDGTKVWHYSHICKGAKIGKHCNIGQNVFIAGDAIIGDNCKVQNNVSIYAGVEAGNYVFFGPSCVLTNDINPRGMHSKAGHYMKTKIEDGVTLGANCTIVCGHTLGKHSLIGAGAVVTKDVEPYSIIVGNPGKKIGTIDELGNRKLTINGL